MRVAKYSAQFRGMRSYGARLLSRAQLGAQPIVYVIAHVTFDVARSGDRARTLQGALNQEQCLPQLQSKHSGKVALQTPKLADGDSARHQAKLRLQRSERVDFKAFHVRVLYERTARTAEQVVASVIGNW